MWCSGFESSLFFVVCIISASEHACWSVYSEMRNPIAVRLNFLVYDRVSEVGVGGSRFIIEQFIIGGNLGRADSLWLLNHSREFLSYLCSLVACYTKVIELSE